MSYPHRAPFPTRWNDNDVYGHLNNTVYYEAMDTTINAWLMATAGLDPTAGEPIGGLRVVVVRVPRPRRPSRNRSRWACGPAGWAPPP